MPIQKKDDMPHGKKVKKAKKVIDEKFEKGRQDVVFPDKNKGKDKS